MFIRRSIFATAVSAAAWLMSSTASAQIPTFDAWNGFEVQAVGSSWTLPFDTAPITFSGVLSAPAYLKIVDLGLAGDRYEVLVNGVSVGRTSVPTLQLGAADPSYFFGDEALALANSNISRGLFALPQGTVTVNVFATDSPVDYSIAAFQVTAVPEPAAVATLIAGLGFIGLVARRRARSSTQKISA